MSGWTALPVLVAVTALGGGAVYLWMDVPAYESAMAGLLLAVIVVVRAQFLIERIQKWKKARQAEGPDSRS